MGFFTGNKLFHYSEKEVHICLDLLIAKHSERVESQSLIYGFKRDVDQS